MIRYFAGMILLATQLSFRKTLLFVMQLGLYASLSSFSWSGEYIGERNTFNRFHGQGTYVSGRGLKYEGNWIDGRKSGKGVQTWSNGDIYNGDWLENKRNGLGVQTWADGGKYDGEWVGGKRNGKGVYTFVNGDVYTGSFRANIKKGQGEIVYKNGSRYRGSWDKDLRAGKGLIIYKNGSVLEGQWKEGKFAGRGTFATKKYKYTGVIRNGKPHGVGSCVQGGKKSSCEFKNGNRVVPVVVAVAPKPKPKPKPAKVVPKPVSKPVVVAPKPKPKPRTPAVSSKPHFQFDHNWYSGGKYRVPVKSGYTKDARHDGDMRIRTENEKFLLTITIDEYKGPGEYPLRYFAGVVSEKGVASYATSSDKVGKVKITRDDGKTVSGIFQMTLFRNGNASGGEARIVNKGSFSVLETP
ncbi:MAG: hypothetical protein KUG82_11935 [Pseudomonadales bacterium]|nr:hypothetical protein [Pseudomonadales bacterium]